MLKPTTSILRKHKIFKQIQYAIYYHLFIKCVKEINLNKFSPSFFWPSQDFETFSQSAKMYISLYHVTSTQLQKNNI